ncbi:MAG: AAA family ATPase [Candidatus Omnitrophota bacterium]
MYCNYYGFKERPFNVTSDPEFFFLSRKHQEALSHLLYGVTQRKGIIVVTGEIGTGKTTLCRFFLNRLDRNIKTALILNPYFSEAQLLEAIVKDFGIRARENSRLTLVWELNKFLLNESRRGNNVVLIIDEAQNLKPPLLEQLRLLSNLETEKEKLLQVVLIGQPELNQRLELYELRQLRQRIMVRYHIAPLEPEEIKEYVHHRLKIAGASPSKIIFAQEAFPEIAHFSNGTPRLINALCDRALLAGFAQETSQIGLDIINRCVQELKVNFMEQAIL